MKYHLFSGLQYYPNGGAADYVKSSDSLEELQTEETYEDEKHWAHITDENFKIIYVFEFRHWIDREHIKDGESQWQTVYEPRWVEYKE